MSPEREEICRKCLMHPNFDHPDYPACIQPIAPINEEEWKLTGLKSDDMITPEGIRKMMEIGMLGYCREKMLASEEFCEAWGLTCTKS